MQRKGVPFTGFVPTTAMVTPDANGNYNFNWIHWCHPPRTRHNPATPTLSTPIPARAFSACQME